VVIAFRGVCTKLDAVDDFAAAKIPQRFQYRPARVRTAVVIISQAIYTYQGRE
jgi:hypothetical protein